LAEAVFTSSLLEGLKRDAMHTSDVAAALDDIRRRFADLGIPFAVVGALAMRQHGYVRFTEDIDIVTTPAGLKTIHDELVGRGLVPRATGLKKKLRHTEYKVNIDVIQAGEHAGDASSPVVYPDPTTADFEAASAGVRYATLPALIRFKLASGIWGKRPRNLADVQELVKSNKLSEEWSSQLPEKLRAKFIAIVRASTQEKDIE
jgi:hypothetical protein